ncbi:MAG: hypothetical protein IJA07_10110 [Agathobacter sp.]|nr:hypothetical protein [Agathobacter sp.]
MSNGLYLATNPGAILRRMFPKQLKSPLMIIVWTIVFILNIVAVVFVQNNLIYNIDDFSEEALQELSYFEDCKIISVDDYGDYYVTYQNGEGEMRIACLDAFPVTFIERARVDKGYDRVADENGYIEMKEDTIADWFFDGHSIPKLAAIYIILGVVILLFEFFLYEVFYRLFRE